MGGKGGVMTPVAPKKMRRVARQQMPLIQTPASKKKRPEGQAGGLDMMEVLCWIYPARLQATEAYIAR